MPTFTPGIKSSTSKGIVSTSILDIRCTKETIYVFPGTLSKNDIKIKYTTPTTRLRTPKHIHFTVDLLLKKEHEPKLVNALIKEFLKCWNSLTPLTSRDYNSIYTNLNLCRKASLHRKFSPLDKYGTYSTDFLLTFGELLMIQEKTNFPSAYMFSNMLNALSTNSDIYSIISTATHNGR